MKDNLWAGDLNISPNIAIYYGHANQNLNEVSPHNLRMAIIKKYTNNNC